MYSGALQHIAKTHRTHSGALCAASVTQCASTTCLAVSPIVTHVSSGAYCVVNKYVMREIIDEIAVMLILFLMGLITWVMLIGAVLVLIRHIS